MLVNRNYDTQRKLTRNTFGVELSNSEYQKIKGRLELLRDRCPSQCSFDFRFNKRNDRYIARIKISSLQQNFCANKIAYNPYQAYLLAEEDIDAQLADWKKNRNLAI